ncbi:cell division protein FtsQ/DivIB [Peribacillus sp. SCS-155]|uniref:cell division protein FtsQ/DivIB n=1 Tax=Peribacillus sedimenti TaxID=3115297 RepID=UPI003906953A
MEKGNVVSIEDRIPKLKQLRKRKANRRLILLLSLFFILVICVMYFLSPLSRIKTIKVEGNRYLSSAQIIGLSGLTSETSIWKVNKEESTQNIKTNPEIKKVTIKTQFPNTVLITVEENTRTAYLVKEDRFLPILENGKILPPLKKGSIPVYAPVLVDFKEGNALHQLMSELDKLPPEIVNSISEIHRDPTKSDVYHIRLFMNDGFEVSASSSTLSDKLVHYPSIISQLNPNVKGVIDLEVGSYFKAYNPPNSKKKPDGADE